MALLAREPTAFPQCRVRGWFTRKKCFAQPTKKLCESQNEACLWDTIGDSEGCVPKQEHEKQLKRRQQDLSCADVCNRDVCSSESKRQECKKSQTGSCEIDKKTKFCRLVGTFRDRLCRHRKSKRECGYKEECQWDVSIKRCKVAGRTLSKPQKMRKPPNKLCKSMCGGADGPECRGRDKGVKCAKRLSDTLRCMGRGNH